MSQPATSPCDARIGGLKRPGRQFGVAEAESAVLGVLLRRACVDGAVSRLHDDVGSPAVGGRVLEAQREPRHGSERAQADGPLRGFLVAPLWASRPHWADSALLAAILPSGEQPRTTSGAPV